MTTVIDERVVEMRFNNADFEKNVAQSMETLESLKKSLNFDSANSLSSLSNAAKGFSLTGMTEAITEATTKFSALEIAGITAIANITNKAVDFGLNFVKSLSIDQVSSGFDKYAEKTTAVQTIIAATSKSIGEVEAQMEKLNWFTDETSYNFSDMAGNIGKFTSNGVELDKAASAMQGIATWAARSGQNAVSASRAMYNMSQAIGAGYMKLQDWKSIENANMATIEFKQTAIDTAVELGKLKKTADGLITTLDGKEAVTTTNFSETLKKKWFDTEVMVATLNKYNSYAEELYALSEKTGRTATQLMIDADKYAEGSLKIEEVSKSTGVSVEELAEAYESLNSETNKLSREAFKNAQEAKTFKEVMDATADAVSTGWMNTFQLIFGNYEEAKALWSGMANDLINAFTALGTLRNDILSFWRSGDIDGRTKLLEGLLNTLNLFVKPLDAIRMAFASMLPDAEGMGNILKDMTVRFAEFTKKIQPSEQVLKDIYFIFKGLFTIGKLVINIFTGVVKAILPVTQPFGSLLEMVIHFLGYIGAVITVVGEMINESNALQVIITLLTAVFSNLGSILKMIVTIIGGALVGGVGLFVTLLTKAVTAVTNFVKNSKILTTIVTSIGNAFSKISGFINGFKKTTDGVTTVTKKLEKNFSGANEVIAQSGTITREASGEFKQAMTPLEALINVIKNIGNVFKAAALGIVAGFKSITSGIKNFFTDFANRFKTADLGSKNFFDHIKALFKTFFSYFEDMGVKIGEFFGNFGINTEKIGDIFRKIGDGIKIFVDSIVNGKVAAIAFAVALLALVGAATKVSSSISSLISSVSGVFNSINKFIKGQFAKSSIVTDLAKSFAIIAASLALLTYVDQSALENVSKIMLKLMAAFTGCAIALKAFDFIFSKFSKGIEKPFVSLSLLELAGAIAILAGAMFILDKVEVGKDWPKKLAIIGVMLLELVAASALVSKFAPRLSKGSLLILAMAMAMKVMCEAMLTITNKDLTRVQENLVGFSALFLATSVMIAACGKIRLTSALSLILLAKAFEVIFPALADAISAMDGNGTFTGVIDRVQKFVDKVKEFFIKMYDTLGLVGSIVASGAAIGTLVGGVVLLTQFFKAIGAMGNILKGVGIAAAGIGVAIILVAKAMERIAEIKKGMSAEDFKQVADVISEFIATLGLIFAVISLVDMLGSIAGNLLGIATGVKKNFIAMGLAFVGIGAAMILISVALKIASTIEQDDIVKTGLVIGGLMAVLAIVASATGTIKSGMTAIMSMMAIVAAVAALIAEIAIVSMIIENGDPTILAAAFASVLLLMAVIGGVIYIASDMKSALPMLIMMIGIIGSMAAIGTVLYALQDIPWDSFKGAVAAMGAVLGEVVLAVAVLSVATLTNATLGDALAMITMLGGVLVAFGVIGYTLYKLQGITWESLSGVVKAIGLVMLELGGLGLTFSLIAHFFKKDLVPTLLLMIGTIVTLAAVGTALFVLSKITWDQFIPTIKAIGLVMGEMVIFAAAIGAITKFLVGANFITALILLVGTIGALVAVGVTLWKLSSISWEELKGPLMAISGVMGIMTLFVGVLGAMVKLNSDLKGILGMLGVLAGMCGMLAMVGYELSKLAQIPIDDLQKAQTALLYMIGAITGLLAVVGLVEGALGAIGGAFGAGAGAAVGFFAVPAVLLSIGAAFIMLGNAMVLGATAITILSGTLQVLYEGLAQLATLDLPSIALGLTELGGACIVLGAGLLVFGVGGTIGAAGFALLGLALNVFNTSAQEAIPNLQSLAEIDLGSIALGFTEIGLSGVVMLLGAAGISACAVAIGKLALAIQALQEVKGTIKNFSTDVANELTQGAVKTSLISKVAGLLTGKGWETGFREGTQWHSPPAFLVQFMADCGYTLSDNWELVKTSAESGAEVGGGFVTGLVETVKEGLSGLKDAMGDLSFDLGNLGFDFGNLGDKVDAAMENLTGFTDGLDLSNYMSDLLGDSLNDLTDDLGGVGEGLDATSEKAGKAGKSLKDLIDTVKDKISGMDIFSKFEMKTEMTAQQMLDNMKSNLDGMASWSHRLAVLAERGLDKGLYEKLAEMGPQSYEQVNAFINMTDEQLQEANKMFQTSLAMPDKVGEIVGAGFTYAGEMATKGFSDALDAHKAEHAAAQMGQGAIDGIDKKLEINSPSKVFIQKAYWCCAGFEAGLNTSASQTCIRRGIGELTKEIIALFDEGLSPEKMVEVGNTMLHNMFDNMVTYDEGENPVVLSFVEAFSEFELIDEALTTFVEHLIETICELFEMEDVETRSEVFYKIATMMILGLIEGLRDEEFNVSLMSVINDELLFMMMDSFNTTLDYQVFYDIGANIVAGLANGINENAQSAIDAATDLATKVMEIMKDIPGVESPSKVTRSIGSYISLGLALGIKDTAENVYEAAKEVTEGAIEPFNNINGSINDLLNNSLDFNPIITPMLDLSYIQSQVSELDSMLNSPEYGMNLQNGGNTSNSPQQITFTQNNYSPKSLSRYEIYRQTNRQLSAMRKVVTA